MRIVVEKNGGGYGFSDFPVEEMQAIAKALPLINKLQSEISGLKDDVNALKALVMVERQPSLKERVDSETAKRHKLYPEDADAMGLPKISAKTEKQGYYKRKARVNTPTELSGFIKNIYDDICNGLNTSTKLAEKYPEKHMNGTLSSIITHLYRYGFISRTGTHMNYTYSKGSDFRVNVVKQLIDKPKHGNYNTSPDSLRGNSKLIYQKISEGFNNSKILSTTLNIPQNNITGTLKNLFKRGFIGRYKEPNTIIYKYSIANPDQIATKQEEQAPIPKRTTMTPLEQRVFEAVKNGKTTAFEIAQFLGLKKQNNVNAYLQRLHQSGKIERKAKLTPEYRRYFSYSIPIEKTEKKEEPKAVETNPFEASVRGLAKHLDIFVTENGIKNLAKDSNWEMILKHAQKEGIRYLALDTIKARKSLIYGGKKEEVTETAENEPGFICPQRLVGIIGEPASQKIMEFMRSCGEKKTITPQDFAKFLYGADEKDINSLWNGWFSTNIFWLVKEAFGRSINAKLEKNPDDSSFIVKW